MVGSEITGAQQPTTPEHLVAFTTHPEWFRSFLNNTDQKAVQQEVLIDGLQSMYPSVWRKAIDPKYRLSVLMLGAGNGWAELGIISNLRNKRGTSRNIHVHWEDPSTQMGDEFYYASHQMDLGQAVDDYETRLFEDPSYKPPSSDIALAFQMWHYVDGWQNTPKAKNTLSKLAKSVARRNGVAIISLQSTASDNFAIRSKYIPVIHNMPELASENVVEELQSLGIDHSYFVHDSSLSLESLFQNGEFNPNLNGQHLLSFILRKNWNTLSESLRYQVGEDIKKTVELNGEKKFVLRDGYIWIPGAKFDSA